MLSGLKIATDQDVREACKRIFVSGPPTCSSRAATPSAMPSIGSTTARRCSPFRAPRVDTANTHGTGCTLSAAIAAHLALALPVREAIAASKEYITAALSHAYPLGRGHGPVNHLFALHPGGLADSS